MTMAPPGRSAAPRPGGGRRKGAPDRAEPVPPQQRWRDADGLRWAARHWAARIGVGLRSVHVRPMTTKWASISTAGRLTLDASLLTLPRDLGEFVVVHELVHLLCPGARHGRVFTSFMAAYLPDWEGREERLQGYAKNRSAISSQEM